MTFDKTDQARSPVISADATNITSAARPLAAGELIADRYRIVSLIGQGAMGSVYLVDQVLLKKRLAMKTLNPIAATDTVLRRFHNEAQTMSRLKHPNIVGSIDFGLIDNQPFLVMDYVEGQNLSQVLKEKGKLSVELALQIFIPICFAIGYAHQEGVVHRDIKPGNILLAKSDSIATDFTPMIVDFGISKLASADEAQALTRTGEVFGTPLYMSPEQCSGAKIDKRSDIYSLGCVIYEALTGSPPFFGPTALETMMQHSTGHLPSMRDASLGHEIPAALENIVAKMLAKDPRDRYQSCLETAEDLIRFQSNPLALSVKRIVDQKETNSSKSKLRKGLWSTVAVCTIFGALGYAWYAGGERVPARKEPAVDAVDAQKKQQLQNKQNLEQTSVLSLQHQSFVPPDDSFSTVVAGSSDVTFQFAPDTTLGQIIYWDLQGQKVMQDAKGTITFPLTTKRIFIPSDTLLWFPASAQYFNDDDFQGLFANYTLPDPEPLERTNEALTRLRGLRLMCLANCPVGADSVAHIKALPYLTWLVSKKSLDPLTIANFQRLRQLKVLAVAERKNVRPILKKLSGSSALKRLGLETGDIIVNDIALIAKCRSLTHLDLLNTLENPNLPLTDQDREKCMAQLASLPNLRYLAPGLLIGAPFKLAPAVLAHLSAMKKLEVLFLEHKPPPEEIEQIRRYLSPHCRIVTWSQTDNPERWFDPRYSNPDVDNLW